MTILNEKEIERKLNKLLERKDKILHSDTGYNESKEELLTFLEKFIILEKHILLEKGGKLLEKDEDLKKYILNLEHFQKIINKEDIKKIISIG